GSAKRAGRRIVWRLIPLSFLQVCVELLFPLPPSQLRRKQTMLSYARLLLSGQAARRSGYWKQLRCSLLLFLVLTSCRGEMTAVQDQGTIQQAHSFADGCGY
ncbi:hypothetical protein GBAR_LOCUS13838, partial [Geodia barretti]